MMKQYLNNFEHRWELRGIMGHWGGIDGALMGALQNHVSTPQHPTNDEIYSKHLLKTWHIMKSIPGGIGEKNMLQNQGTRPKSL